MATLKTSERVLDRNSYLDGGYGEKNPLWHVDESPFKVRQILRMIEKHKLHPATIGEVGCGVGENLRMLQERMDPACRFYGYEISPQAFERCQSRANSRLEFRLSEISEDQEACFDLLLVLDVLEHVADYFGFLAKIRSKGDLKLFHIPLDLSVQAVVRRNGLLARRDRFGHLQYFTKETALRTLTESGYELIDYFFTPRCIEMGDAFAQKLLRLPRRLCFAMNQDLAVRILGGYSLLVLTR